MLGLCIARQKEIGCEAKAIQAHPALMSASLIPPALANEVYRRILSSRQAMIDTFNKPLPMPTVSWDVKGRVASYARLRKGDIRIRLNAKLFLENVDLYLLDTIPHEVGHIATKTWYPRASSHGHEWVNILRSCGFPANRCHSYPDIRFQASEA